MKSFRDTLEAVAIALLLAFVIRAFIVQAFKIPSGSMLETLQIGDHLLVSKFAYDVRLPSNVFLDTTDGKVLYRTGDPERGDIIVFKFPEDESKDFIKRVIGLPGETIEIKKKVVYIDGTPLDEPYVMHTKAEMNPIRDNFGPYTVPEDEFFMMGDNREGPTTPAGGGRSSARRSWARPSSFTGPGVPSPTSALAVSERYSIRRSEIVEYRSRDRMEFSANRSPL